MSTRAPNELGLSCFAVLLIKDGAEAGILELSTDVQTCIMPLPL